MRDVIYIPNIYIYVVARTLLLNINQRASSPPGPTCQLAGWMVTQVAKVPGIVGQR